jgi:hypothetical protein
MSILILIYVFCGWFIKKSHITRYRYVIMLRKKRDDLSEKN